MLQTKKLAYLTITILSLLFLSSTAALAKEINMYCNTPYSAKTEQGCADIINNSTYPGCEAYSCGSATGKSLHVPRRINLICPSDKTIYFGMWDKKVAASDTNCSCNEEEPANCGIFNSCTFTITYWGNAKEVKFYAGCGPSRRIN